MDFLSEQAKFAKTCKELRRKIPRKLEPYIDIRPRGGGMTLVSLFDFAPMRGIEVNTQKALEVINKFKRISNLLISSNIDERKKLDELKKIGFEERCETEKKHLKDYLEEDVQACLIRELLSPNASSKSITNVIQNEFGFSKLIYLTSELELNLNGKQNRIDILCFDELNHRKILILEIKKIRLTNLNQGKYVTILKKCNKNLLDFISALKGIEYSKDDSLEIHMIYVMPDNENTDTKSWKEVLETEKEGREENRNVDGIIFYQTGFPATRHVIRGK